MDMASRSTETSMYLFVAPNAFIVPIWRLLSLTEIIMTFIITMPDMSAALGPYVPLIIVNCIIICRAEACASKNGLAVSILDAVGMGLGFTLTLGVLAAIRELLSTGRIFDIVVMPSGFVPWAAMSMPVGAFITLGLLLGLVNIITKKAA